MASVERASEPTNAKETKMGSRKRERDEDPWEKIPPAGDAMLESLKRFVYVDKTNLLGRVMAHPEKYIFAPSMRRCGKSFTIMLLEAMASGKRGALEGLDICGENTTWELPQEGQYDVISLDFSLVSTSDATKPPEMRIATYLRKKALYAGFTIPDDCMDTNEVLHDWIEKLSQGKEQSVVVLIDEYDTLLTPFLADPEKLERNSSAMKSVFVTLKALHTKIFKVFVTGGLKAGMSGLFSGANNFYRLLDRDHEYSSMFGFTKDEVKSTYGALIREIFSESSLDESLEEMEKYYNGYRLHPKQESTFLNPFSTVNYLRGRMLIRYWADTLSSGQLDDMLLRHGSDALRGCRVTWKTLLRPVGKDAYAQEWKSILFQSGYLSILEVDGEELVLGPPNAEVTEYLTEEIPRLLKAKAVSQGLVASMVDYSKKISSFRFEEAAEVLTEVLNGLDYSLLNENEFAGWALHMLRLFVNKHFEHVFTEISQRIDTDQKGTNAKRFDGALVVNNNGVFSAVIVELKFDKTAQEAYTQITDRNYVERCEKFLLDKLQISVAKENWHSVGFNLTNAPKKIVSCCDGS